MNHGKNVRRRAPPVLCATRANFADVNRPAAQDRSQHQRRQPAIAQNAALVIYVEASRRECCSRFDEPFAILRSIWKQCVGSFDGVHLFLFGEWQRAGRSGRGRSVPGWLALRNGGTDPKIPWPPRAPARCRRRYKPWLPLGVLSKCNATRNRPGGTILVPSWRRVRAVPHTRDIASCVWPSLQQFGDSISVAATLNVAALAAIIGSVAPTTIASPSNMRRGRATQSSGVASDHCHGARRRSRETLARPRHLRAYVSFRVTVCYSDR